ncbi:MAG: TIGR02281 family clan AA aspartic protease [Chloroflexota bacterium]
MWRLLFMVGSISVSAIGAVTFIERNQGKLTAPAKTDIVTERATPIAEPKAQVVRLSGQERILRGPRGHYEATFKINNARIQGLIDTGATTVAINESTARKAGLRLNSKDFKYPVRTANGQTMAATATISQISIGSIRIRDVEAMVLRDDSLSHTLIGMSFLNRLKGFEYQSGNLVLKR